MGSHPVSRPLQLILELASVLKSFGFVGTEIQDLFWSLPSTSMILWKYFFFFFQNISTKLLRFPFRQMPRGCLKTGGGSKS